MATISASKAEWDIGSSPWRLPGVETTAASQIDDSAYIGQTPPAIAPAPA
jgi:hypothetical protein